MKKATTLAAIVTLTLMPELGMAQSAPTSMEKAAEAGSIKDTDKLNQGNIDFLVPSSPAFHILGVKPTDISRPGSPRDLAIALLEGTDPNGNLQSGVALDMAPYQLLRPEMDFDTYNANINAFLSRTQLSFATTKGSNKNDESIKMALGLRITPFDFGDPHLNGSTLRTCATTENLQKKTAQLNHNTITEESLRDDILDAINVVKGIDKSDNVAGILSDNNGEINQLATITLQATSQSEKERLAGYLAVRRNIHAQLSQIDPSDSATSTLAVVELERAAKTLRAQINEIDAIAAAEINKLIADCRKEVERKDWNATSLSLGIAPTWLSESGSVGDTEWTGLGLWSTFSYGFEGLGKRLDEGAQLLAHIQYRSDELKPDQNNDGQFFEQDTFKFALQGRFAVPDLISETTEGNDANFFVDIAYTNEDRDNREDEEFLKYTVGIEFKVAEQQFLQISMGTEDGKDTESNNEFVHAGFKWAFSEKPTKGVMR